MKAISATLLLLTAGVILSACESDLPPAKHAEGPLQRGLTGQGKIVPIDRANDAMTQETSGRVIAPAY